MEMIVRERVISRMPEMPMPQRPEISVIIVNYGTASMAVEAVESIRARQHGGRPVDIHLVDNASAGDDAAILSGAHRALGWGPQVTLYLETTNHGFGRGNNLVLRRLGARTSPPDKVLLLNPDARLENEALDSLARFLDEHPRVGCVGAAITNPDGRRATAAFRFPTAASEFSDSLAFGPIARLLAPFAVPLPPDLPTQRVDWVAGAAAMFRWRALEQAQGFDPAYFLYYEEVDLMRRLAEQGWETWHVAEAMVWHVEGAATLVRSGETQRRAKPDYWYDSWLAYHVKARGLWGARLCALARLCGWSLNRVLSAARRRPTLAPARYVEGFARRVLRPLVGLPARDPL